MFSNPDLDRGEPVTSPAPTTNSEPARSKGLELRNIFSNPNLPRGLPSSPKPAPLVSSELDLRRIFSNPEMHTPPGHQDRHAWSQDEAIDSVKSQAQLIRDNMAGASFNRTDDLRLAPSSSAEVLSPAMRISEDMSTRR